MNTTDNRTFLNTGGFTLVETLVTLAIFTSMLAAISMTLIAGQNSWDVNRVRIEMQQNLRQASERMKDELSEASSDSIVNVDPDGEWYTNIVFRTPESITNSGVITWPVDTTKFLLGGTNNKQLLRRVAEGEANESEKIIATNIKVLKFKRESASDNILEISMQAEMKVGTGTVNNTTMDYTAKVQLRN